MSDPNAVKMDVAIHYSIGQASWFVVCTVVVCGRIIGMEQAITVAEASRLFMHGIPNATTDAHMRMMPEMHTI
jgi:hypothetical protein